jgi:predicted alpha/beta hydrolase family esterase
MTERGGGIVTVTDNGADHFRAVWERRSMKNAAVVNVPQEVWTRSLEADWGHGRIRM